MRDLFGPLVYEKHDQVCLRVVVGDGAGDLFDESGLAGLRGRDYQPSLPLADGGDQVDHAQGYVVVAPGKLKALGRIDAYQIGEFGPAEVLFGAEPVYLLDGGHLVRLGLAAPGLRRAGLARDEDSLPKSEFLNQVAGDEYITRAGQVIARGLPEKAEAFLVDLQYA